MTAQPAPAKLPYGVEDVLKLTQAQVNEDVVLNYVLNSGTAYSLNAGDIVYLRNQGVSDHVITTMMNQRNHVAEEAAAQQAATMPAPVYAEPGTPVAAAPYYAEPGAAALRSAAICALLLRAAARP